MTRKIVRLSICVIMIVGLFLSNVPSGLAHWINDESDTLTHGIVRHASMVSDGAQGNSDSWKAIISADGRYMAYSSFVSNQV